MQTTLQYNSCSYTILQCAQEIKSTFLTNHAIGNVTQGQTYSVTYSLIVDVLVHHPHYGTVPSVLQKTCALQKVNNFVLFTPKYLW